MTTLERDLTELLTRGVAEGVFPGAVALVLDGDEVAARLAVGNRMVVPEMRPMLPDTLFDLASLTKPLATASCVLSLGERGSLRLDDSVADYLPEFRRREVTIRHLLTHTSGLPAWKALYLDPGDSDAVIAHLGELPASHPVGAKIVYSCLGYILLGKLVERVAGVSLARFADERLFRPLGMKETCFNPPEEWRHGCAATESSNGAEKRMVNCARYDWRDGVLCGVVHDENAHFLGGVSGNAGLFSTADDLALFARALLNDGAPVFCAETYALMHDVAVDDGETRRTHAWIALEDGTRTHTGFAGTAFRWHPERRRAAILLTNRVHPDATNNRILDFRVEFFRAVFG